MSTVNVFIGFGTLINVIGVIIGSMIGRGLGGLIPDRIHAIITDALGLITLVVAATSIAPLFAETLSDAVGSSFVFIVILASVLGGTVIGSLLRLEDCIDSFGGWILSLKRTSANDPADSAMFIRGFVTASLLFCVGPLTILGSLTEGLGLGPDQLLTKTILDFFTSIALASSLGWGVLIAALPVLVVEGSFTALGAFLGTVITEAQADAMSVVGGVIMIGLGIRLLGLKHVRVADMLPALIIGPGIVALFEVFA